MSKYNGKARWITVIITIVLLLTTVIYAFSRVEGGVNRQAERHDTLKVEGCLPSRDNKVDIMVLKTQQQVILTTTEDNNRLLKKIAGE